jgi:hypothetical protein
VFAAVQGSTAVAGGVMAGRSTADPSPPLIAAVGVTQLVTLGSLAVTLRGAVTKRQVGG